MVRLRKLWSDRQGAALVEFTLALPVMLSLGLGVIEFSRVLYQYHQIVTGVGDAARYLSHISDPMGAQTAAKEIAVYGQVGGSTKRVSWWNVADVTVTVRTIANPIDPGTGLRTYRGPDPISIVKVSTSATYTGLGFLAYLGMSAGIPLNAFQEDRVIGN
jgi:hypothetical protein